MRPTLPSPACAVLLLCLFTFGCSGGTPFTAGTGTAVGTPPVTPPVTVSTGSQNASVSVMVSDPAACKAPNGPLAHVYMTIADVKASTKADASANDSSFVDLTPGLSKAPQQVDLLGQATSEGFLASLGINQQAAAGDYKQMRIILVPDAMASSIQNGKNACGAGYANCVVRADNSLYDLQLSAETTTGIIVPVGQLANGGLALDTGSKPLIDLNFDVCSSAVPVSTTSGDGYELKPILHAGLVSTTGDPISGTVVSSKTGQALQGGQVVVALEQKDATGVDRILMRTTANNDGTFVLHPVPHGTYDLVAVGVDGASISYSAGVETGIQSGQSAEKIPLVPGSEEGTLQGLITTQNSGPPAIGVSVAVQTDALQQLADSGPTITVPLLPADSPYNEAMLTTDASNCLQGVDCAAFSMKLPGSTPNVVACSEQTAQFKQDTGTTPNYMAESFAQVPSSGGLTDCVRSNVIVPSIAMNPNQSATAANLTFTQCQSE